jgi:hypothetical protein
MLMQLQALFEGGSDFETAAAMANIKTKDGIKTARVFWSVLERIAEFEADEAASQVEKKSSQ